MKASETVQEYYAQLLKQANNEYALAQRVRAVGLDPSLEVETTLAEDLAARVEGLIGPKGVAEDIRESLAKTGREETVVKIVDNIVSGKYGQKTDNEKAEQSIRTGLALFTEAVVAAPIEGISKVAVEENPDGSHYLGVYFAGPIRSAGGTAQAVAVLLADYTRTLMKLEEYRPTDTEVERYVEELTLYHTSVSRLQYKPSDDDVRVIVKNCPVCVNGDPTSEVEVDVYKDIPRVPSNRVRGGLCLVIGEGIAQKALKISRLAKKFGVDWPWLKQIIKTGKKEETDALKPNDVFIKDVVAGRPILSYPSRAGGFRLRYGKSRNNGLMAKGIHPSTMHILGGFAAIGTQLKVERPGKGMTCVPVDTIEGPVVMLKNGSVVIVENEEHAIALEKDVEEILFNGDLLVSFGDFLHSNHPIVASPYVEEWWIQEVWEKGGVCEDAFNVSLEKAFEYSEKYGVPLHPKYVFNYHDLAFSEMQQFIAWLAGDLKVGEGKKMLERLLVPHKVEGDKVVIEEPWKTALFTTLDVPASAEKIGKIKADTSMQLVNELSKFIIKEKAPVYVGTRMGRPEKARERLMTPAPNLLFPVGNYGGSTRSVVKAAEQESITVNIANLVCTKCGEQTDGWKCKCGGRAEVARVCPQCGRRGDSCPACHLEGRGFVKKTVDIKRLLNAAEINVGKADPKMKGVKGTMSEAKMFEPLEKGILRANNRVYLFKDGTIRFDQTNLPLTHFTPKEIGTRVEVLRSMGYKRDKDGEELLREDQVVELFAQDVVPSVNGADYLLRVTKFLDELLEKFYGMEAYYKAEGKEDLVGRLVIGLAPHTSAGILGRIIGFSKARACYAHPYFHAATRRDADGDENSIMMMLDCLINFSKAYLPSSRGGKMDAALVLTTALDPSQIDDQVHEMEVINSLPLEFYRKTREGLKPADFDLEVVADRLGKDTQYDGFGFTHATSAIDAGVVQSSYTKFEAMEEKVRAQLNLGRKIRAVDERDEAKRLLNSHFLRDIYGNLRAFGEQKFRCVECNTKYRRVPLIGKCVKCGGKVILTIAEGSVRKYLEISKNITREYGLSDYMKQRLQLVENSINSVFINDKSKQYSLTDFL